MPIATELTSKFNSLETSYKGSGTNYSLLPVRFLKLDDKRYLVTNIAGEYLILENKELYSFLNKKIEINSHIYNELKSKHMLIDSDSSVAIDLLAAKYRTKFKPITNFTSLHMFVVSLRCDHTCPYCQVSRQTEDKKSFDMTPEMADKALGFTFKSPNPYIKIEFQGGESLLNFELIKYIVNRAEIINETEKRNLQFVIATNLSQINDEILDYCLKHKILISTSLDGPEELHNNNRHRPGNDSYKKAIDGINKVREVLGFDQVSALMTTTIASLSKPKEIIDEYVRMKFPSIFLRPLSPYGFAVKTGWINDYTVEDWLNFYKTGLSYIIELNQQGIYLREEYTTLILEKILTPYGTAYVDLQSPAGIGISGIVFNYNGDVYASDESRMLAEMGDNTFRIGNLLHDNYEDVMLSEKLIEPIEMSLTESVPMCSDCAVQPYCGSDPVMHHALQKDIVGHKPTSYFCKKNMEIIKHIIRLLQDDKNASEVLLRWVR